MEKKIVGLNTYFKSLEYENFDEYEFSARISLLDYDAVVINAEYELKMVSYHLTKGEQLEAILNSTFKQLEDITDVHEMTNAQLKRLINKIEVDKDGNVDIYLHLIGDLGLDETVLIEGDKNTEEKGTKKVPNSYNHT